MNKLLTHIPAWLKSKYVIAITVFAVVLLFLDKNDFISQLSRTKQLKELQESKEYYTNSINAEQKELNNLRANNGTLEKYAREKYLMKRDNEDLFLIPDNQPKENN
ncbi:MAG: septum formation initiator family protein [Chitinophagaceae bacterium]